MVISFDNDRQREDFYVTIIFEIGDNETLAKNYFGKPEYRSDLRELEKDTEKLQKIQEKIEKKNYNFTIGELDLIITCLKNQILKSREKAEDFSELKMEGPAEEARRKVDSLCDLLKRIQE